jgi:hypothetical protein
MLRCFRPGFLCVMVSALLALGACSTHTYQPQVVPFKLPPAYPSFTRAGGADIAAKAYDDPNEAAKVFGYDMRGSGILPVEIVFDNKGSHPLAIVPGQTFLVDTGNNLWPILDANLAYERIEKKTQMGSVLPQAAKGGVLGAAAGAVLGAAVGIVTRTNVGNAAGTGAAIGAAIGGVAGGTKGAMDTDPQVRIREDLARKSLDNRPIKAREIAYGFVFFPGEAAKAKELRVLVKEVDTGVIHSLIMTF